MFRRLFSVLAFVLITSSCGKSIPSFENIDLDSFRKDKNGCQLYRSAIIESIDLQKDKLLALDEGQIIALLGNPDRNELYKRNQKFFYYYLKPSPDCSSPGENETLRLAVRFNAMGLAKEVALE